MQGILTRSRSRRLASGEFDEEFPSRGGSAAALGSFSDVASEEGSSSSTSRGDGRRRTEGGEKRVSRARSMATAAAERGKQMMTAPVSMLVVRCCPYDWPVDPHLQAPGTVVFFGYNCVHEACNRSH